MLINLLKLMQSKLTIIIPCYNQTHYLRLLLESLKEQTFQDFEIIIIDDFSSENYLSFLEEFRKYFKISYLRNKKNLGAIKNMFYSITFSVKTPYVVCLHEDDFLHKKYLELAIDTLEKNENIIF